MITNAVNWIQLSEFYIVIFSCFLRNGVCICSSIKYKDIPLNSALDWVHILRNRSEQIGIVLLWLLRGYYEVTSYQRRRIFCILKHVLSLRTTLNFIFILFCSKIEFECVQWTVLFVWIFIIDKKITFRNSVQIK